VSTSKQIVDYNVFRNQPPLPTVALILAYSVASFCLSFVCNVCIVAKRCILPMICPKSQTGNDPRGIQWSREWWRHV